MIMRVPRAPLLPSLLLLLKGASKRNASRALSYMHPCNIIYEPTRIHYAMRIQLTVPLGLYTTVFSSVHMLATTVFFAVASMSSMVAIESDCGY